jgi:hypothetical protein
MVQPTNEKLTAIKRQLIDGMVSYMKIDGVAESYDSFYDQTHVDRCERYLDEFAAAAEKAAGNYDQIMALVERVVVALNQLNESCSHFMIETDQREDLCAFIEEAIITSGIDLDALAASRNCTRHEITDEWRDW